jgi:menaquinone-dependent protoporphyrinogen IX oxidase
MFRWFDRWMIKLIIRAQRQAQLDTQARIAKERAIEEAAAQQKRGDNAKTIS